jgi:hypothetical protein
MDRCGASHARKRRRGDQPAGYLFAQELNDLHARSQHTQAQLQLAPTGQPQPQEYRTQKPPGVFDDRPQHVLQQTRGKERARGAATEVDQAHSFVDIKASQPVAKIGLGSSEWLRRQQQVQPEPEYERQGNHAAVDENWLSDHQL